jgi:organic hydroperoxide reductase OsmC/OhrA
MANTREHRYSVSATWTGNLGSGNSGYCDDSRHYEIGADGKAVIRGSSDPAFRGDGSCWNPEELLVASLLACDKLRYPPGASDASRSLG